MAHEPLTECYSLHSSVRLPDYKLIALCQIGTIQFLWNGGGHILLQILPFRLWSFFFALGTGMDQRRDAFVKVSVQMSGNTLLSCQLLRDANM